MKSFVYDRVENLVGNGENAGNSIFSFPHKVFKYLHLHGYQSLGLFGKIYYNPLF